MASSMRSFTLATCANAVRYGTLSLTQPVLPTTTTNMTRLFSTTAFASAKSANSARSKKPRFLPPGIPPYPYKPNINFEPANHGLYGGSTLQTGNKISKGRNKGKTKRTWLPHIKQEKLYSEALGREIKCNVRNRVLRTIAKCGGLDEYLIGDKPARIKELGLFGWKLRWEVLQTPKMQERLRKRRQELGLPEPETYEQYKMRVIHNYPELHRLEWEKQQAAIAEEEAAQRLLEESQTTATEGATQAAEEKAQNAAAVQAGLEGEGSVNSSRTTA